MLADARGFWVLQGIPLLIMLDVILPLKLCYSDGKTGCSREILHRDIRLAL